MKEICNQCNKCGVENTAVLGCADKDCKCHTKKEAKNCEYNSFWDCHANKEHCKKHFRI
jgi:hypothetical protein